MEGCHVGSANTSGRRDYCQGVSHFAIRIQPATTKSVHFPSQLTSTMTLARSTVQLALTVAFLGIFVTTSDACLTGLLTGDDCDSTSTTMLSGTVDTPCDEDTPSILSSTLTSGLSGGLSGGLTSGLSGLGGIAADIPCDDTSSIVSSGLTSGLSTGTSVSGGLQSAPSVVSSGTTSTTSLTPSSSGVTSNTQTTPTTATGATSTATATSTAQAQATTSSAVDTGISQTSTAGDPKTGTSTASTDPSTTGASTTSADLSTKTGTSTSATTDSAAQHLRH